MRGPRALLGLAPLVLVASCADVWGMRDLSGGDDGAPADATMGDAQGMVGEDAAQDRSTNEAGDASDSALEVSGDRDSDAGSVVDAGGEAEAGGDAAPDAGPDAQTGCGPLDAAANCGACGQACSTTSGTPSCNGTRCNYVCASGRADCNAMLPANTEGCECATPGCCGTGCQTIHNTGLPSPGPANYYDCSAIGTAQAQARAACIAFTGNASACLQTTSTGCNCALLICGPAANSICGSSGGKCYCWQYSGPNPGTVQTESASACSATCGMTSDPKFN